MNLFVIRYAEIALKGANRPWFEKILLSNIRRHLIGLGKVHSWKIHGRMVIETEIPVDQVCEILSYIPGIANFSVALQLDHDIKNIGDQAIKMVTEYLEKHPTLTQFKVAATRSEKRFPMNSMALAAQIGGDVLEQCPQLKVDLSHPEIELGVEIWTNDRSIIYLEKQLGQGGLPVGSSGRLISFLSGGIDSPVASWMMSKRGADVLYLNFHSYPFIGEESKEKVIQLVKHLSRYQPKAVLVIAPFTEIQSAIKAECGERYRTLLYRRMMYHIANRMTQKYKVKGYLTGEALGQVASQTLENIGCTEEAAKLPVLRPLVGQDKSEIIELAQKIGTYPISIQPFPDCCTVFQPRKPETKGRIERVLEEEAKLDVEALVDAAMANLEIHKFKTEVNQSFF